ncbi:lipase 3-like [Nylanderia fulva]|uniref:lipase 3-like n=1 Tax=Nylanderia fulva TaxID=613905 RepID=UPI0010FB6CB8|nr:lipase 3-like [Nylanderia fulva]
MIRNKGYPAETHVVTTEDGYLLTVHRIPGGNSSLPVLLIHGLLSSSADFFVLGKGKALGFLLADEGYDVWLGNMRGNLYSRTHISLSPSNLTFWDFSYNEMGTYDLPAIITYITNMRSQPLHAYIGHSMGTTSFYIMGSKRPEIVEKMRLMISFSPTTFMDHMKSPIIILVPLFKKIKIIMDVLFHGELMDRSWFQYFAEFCNRNYSNQRFCLNVAFTIGGFNHEQFNYTLLPLIMNHVPSGASYKTWLHYVQGIESRKFRSYDYGREKNLLMYNSVEPPEYDLSKITVPIFMFYGNNDWLVDPIPEMIRKEGYPVETHVIMTEDGYLLTLYRIPGGKNSLPILVQHGLLASSADWLVLGKNNALPYLLADQGYDVWLGNIRGSTHSRKHISLSTSDPKFWNFRYSRALKMIYLDRY